MNNFNTCKEMEDIEMSIFFDNGMSQMDFDDNFKIIEHSSYGDCSSYLFYTGYNEIEVPSHVSDCFDFSNCTEKDYRAFCIEYAPENMSFRDIVAEKNDSYSWRNGSWESLADEWLNQDGLPDAMRNGFPIITNAIGLYDCVSIHGYSQGDYSTVLYQVEPDSFLEDSSKARAVFTNLVFDSPLYACATVDGEEIYLDEGISDRYTYDKSELCDYIDKQELSDIAKEWLKDNLPEYPDYI